MILLSILLGALLLVIINFLIPTWFILGKQRIIERFFQGRITDISAWENKILHTCKRWLIKTPTVRSNDDSRLTLAQIILKKDQRHSIQVWQRASLYLALREFEGEDHTNQLLSSFEQIIDEQYASKEIVDSDYGMLAFAVMDSHPGYLVEKMKEYIDQNTTPEGIIQYKQRAKGTAFVDMLGFVCPFLTKYGVCNHRPEYIELAKKQISYYVDHGTDSVTGLPFHAITIPDSIPRGICDWGRGLAWLLIALMDSYKTIRDAGKEDAFFLELIRKYADRLIKLQCENGAFKWQLLNGACASDSSTTAVAGWFLACCYKFFREEQYMEHAKRCRAYLMTVTNSDGVIDYSQGDTIGVGIYSRLFTIMPFTQGFALRMQKEISDAEKSL